MGIYFIFGFFMLLGMLVSWRLKSKFKKYSKVPVTSGLTGREVAEKMLQENNIHDVKVVSTPGFLTDHYHPIKKTINLSEDVYHSNSVAAAAVAAHETGHAVQHATAYTWLQMRSKLVPVVSIASGWMHWVLLAGILMINQFPALLLIGIILFSLTVLFSFITLPVEFNASNRALKWLQNTNVTNSQQQQQAKDALWWAAMTYVVSALSALATLLYYVMIYMGRRE